MVECLSLMQVMDSVQIRVTVMFILSTLKMQFYERVALWVDRNLLEKRVVLNSEHYRNVEFMSY